jgi:hypothetical protein
MFRQVGKNFLPVMLGNPLRDCPLQCRASMLTFQFPESRLGQVRHVWPLPSADAILFDVKSRLSREVEGPPKAPVAPAAMAILARPSQNFFTDLSHREDTPATIQYG